MIKRITLFLLAHLALLGIAVALVAASAVPVDAQRSDNPYDMRFVAGDDTDVRETVEESSPIIGTLVSGTRNIRMRWCRPEFDFQGWMFGSDRIQRQQLDERVCEVDAGGQIGFVPASALRVQ